MPDRPSQLWKAMPPEKRAAAAEAFWREEDAPDIRLQQAEAAAILARRLKFRQKSIETLPVEKRARHLAQVADVSDAIATRALISYHFSNQRPLMAAFLDELGIAHENGLIKAEQVDAPDRARVEAAVAAVKKKFEPADVSLYVRTLAALDSETWAAADTLVD